MASFEPATQPAATSVVDAIRRAIMTGALAPGQRLTEDDLAARLDVSRTPVREALRILQAEGYVVSTPYAGSRVRTFSIDDIDAAYEALARLQGLAMRRAATRIQTSSSRWFGRAAIGTRPSAHRGSTTSSR